MSKQRTKEELVKHKELAVQCIETYINELINSSDKKDCGRADKFSYWIEDYIKFLRYEKEFKEDKLRRYKRGEIIKVHLGYNVGSEEGGLHYCVVLDKSNSIKSSTISIVPLTSVKNGKDISNLRNGEVFLGNELFTNLNSKFISKKNSLEEEIKSLSELLTSIENGQCDKKDQSLKTLRERLDKLDNSVNVVKRMQKEIQKMKKGSIAKISQITTISKIRIYDPKTNDDVLSNIKLSNESLNEIDKSIRELYTGNKN